MRRHLIALLLVTIAVPVALILPVCSGRRRPAFRCRVLLQNQVGPRRRILEAVQEKSLSSAEKRSRDGPHH